jgi:hypothetical protein
MVVSYDLIDAPLDSEHRVVDALTLRQTLVASDETLDARW